MRQAVFCASVCLILTLFAMTADSDVRIRYGLSMPRPATHLLEVTVTFSGLPSSARELLLQLPVWRPGRYLVLDFAGGVTRFAATSAAGEALPWHKADKSSWLIQTGGAPLVRASYEVYADEFDQRTRGLDDEHAFVNGAAVFMYSPAFRSHGVELEVVPPVGWHVTTGMDSTGVNAFRAPDYDVFADSPLEIGTQRDFAFEVAGVPHVLSIFGGGNWEPDTLIRDIRKIIEADRGFWGNLPYRRYVFLLHCTPNAGGGTEHVNSTIMGTRPFVFRDPESYRGFLGLVSHEYFHTWNVKQIRPAALAHPDYQKENYTGELWLAEGGTSYFDGLILLKAGLTTRERILEGISRTVYEDRLRPGNAVQSVAQSGFDAWIKYWKGDRESFNEESDYYEKGAAVSMVLDLEIRHATGNARSFADVMRDLYARFPRSGPGYTNADVRTAVARAGGEALGAVFDTLVSGTAPIAWERVLGYAGLELVPAPSPPAVWSGLEAADAGGRARITRVIAGSPAFAAGLDAGDEIVALDGFRIGASGLQARMKDFRPGESLRLTVFRGERLREFTVRLEKPPLVLESVKPRDGITPEEQRVLDSWLPATVSP
ncbi:MAG TPA: PDZ domain-containing protein [Bacteroidota bacterium]|nr:PDZ domain-containing protein [Bacteroidota bacterium]